MKMRNQYLDSLIGGKLKKYRLACGISQDKLGKLIGVSFQQIQKYEKGTNRVSLSTLIEICKWLRCNPTDFISPESTVCPYEKGELIVVENMRKLSEEQKCIVKEIIKQFMK